MSVVSVIAVAGRCEIIKVCTKVCLCWLEFKYASSLLGKGTILWTVGVWLSSRGQIRLAIGGGHNMLRNQGTVKMDRWMDGLQQHPGTAGEWVTPLRNWWTNSLWSWIQLEFKDKFEFQVKLASGSPNSWYLYPRKENKPAGALHNSRKQGTK